jgi:hypothetical protein
VRPNEQIEPPRGGKGLTMSIERPPREVGSNLLLGAVAGASQCRECHGKGWNDAWKKVTGHYMGGEAFREDCEHCEGTGSV